MGDTVGQDNEIRAQCCLKLVGEAQPGFAFELEQRRENWT